MEPKKAAVVVTKKEEPKKSATQPAKQKKYRIYKAAEIKKDAALLKNFQGWVKYGEQTDNDIRVKSWFWIFVQNRKNLIYDGKAHCPIKGEPVCYIATSKSFMTTYLRDGGMYVMRAAKKMPKNLFYYVSSKNGADKQRSGSGYKSASNAITFAVGTQWAVYAASAFGNSFVKQPPLQLETSDVIDYQDSDKYDDLVELRTGEQFAGKTDEYITESTVVIINNGENEIDVYTKNGIVVGISSKENVAVHDNSRLPSNIQEAVRDMVKDGKGGRIEDQSNLTEEINRALVERNNYEPRPIADRPAKTPQQNSTVVQQGGSGGNLVRILSAPIFGGDIMDTRVREAWRQNQQAAAGVGVPQPNATGVQVGANTTQTVASNTQGSPEQEESEARGFLDSFAAGVAVVAFIGAGIGNVIVQTASAMANNIAAAAITIWDWITTPSQRSGGGSNSNDDNCGAGQAGCISASNDDGGGDGDNDDDNNSNSQNDNQTSSSTTTTDDDGTPTDTAVGNGAEYAGPGPEDQPESDTAVVMCMTEECERYRSHCDENPNDLICQSAPMKALERDPVSIFNRNCQRVICDGEGGCMCAGGGSSSQYGTFDLLKNPRAKLHTKQCQKQMCPMENPNCCEQRSSADLTRLRQSILTNLCRYLMTDQGNCSGVSNPYAYCKDNPDDIRCGSRLNNSPTIPVPPPRWTGNQLTVSDKLKLK